MLKRKQHAPEFKAKGAPEALKDDATVSELARPRFALVEHPPPSEPNGYITPAKSRGGVLCKPEHIRYRRLVVA